jgi:hypothetical protein
MRDLPEDIRAEADEYLQQLQSQMADKLRTRLPALELPSESVAPLRKCAVHYKSDIARVFQSRSFRPSAADQRYVIFKAMSRAVAAIQRYPASSESEEGKRRMVISCLEQTVDEVILALDKFFYDLTGEELLFLILTKSPERAKQLVEFSTLEQARGMLEILVAVWSKGETTFYRMPEGAPRNNLDGLTRCVFLRYVLDPQVRGIAEEPARNGTKVLLPLTCYPAQGSLSGREPIDYAAPLNAQIFEKLGREINKHVRPVRDHGISKVAGWMDKDRSTIRRYLKEDLPLEITPDDKGSVDYTLYPDIVSRCVEVVVGKKRGAKPKEAG